MRSLAGNVVIAKWFHLFIPLRRAQFKNNFSLWENKPPGPCEIKQQLALVSWCTKCCSNTTFWCECFNLRDPWMRVHLAQHPGIGPVALIYGNNKANSWHGDSEVVGTNGLRFLLSISIPKRVVFFGFLKRNPVALGCGLCWIPVTLPFPTSLHNGHQSQWTTI